MAITGNSLEGKRFGKLVCEWPVGRTTGSNWVWLCLCDCGNLCLKPTGYFGPKESSLRTQSCGCWGREKMQRLGRERRNGLKHGHAIGGKMTPEYSMWIKAKERAQRAGVPFSIEVNDVRIPERCPILGMPLVIHQGARSVKGDSPTLDRIVPELGYVEGNVWVISFRANRIKSDASLSELLQLIAAMEARLSQGVHLV
jgi:hypothetical protein